MNFKNLLRTSLLSAAILASTFTSTKSHALVGALVASPAVAITGLVVAVGSGVTIISGTQSRSLAKFLVYGYVGVIGGIVGLTILDGENGQSAQFTELDKNQAETLGLTDGELISFNAELDQANMLLSQVSSQATNSEEAAQAWDSLKENVSPETFSAMGKIASKSIEAK